MQKGFHALAIIAAIVWFALNGLLWYAKAGDLLWLLGSAILGVIFFFGFYLYLPSASVLVVPPAGSHDRGRD